MHHCDTFVGPPAPEPRQPPPPSRVVEGVDGPTEFTPRILFSKFERSGRVFGELLAHAEED